MTPSAPLLSSLESFLQLTESRERTISANMANVDTPGYHTRDIDFDTELKKAMNNVATGNASAGAHLSPVVREVSGLMERPDGNNVDLDREGLMMAETQLQYQIGVQLIKHQFHQLLSAINGGGQS